MSRTAAERKHLLGEGDQRQRQHSGHAHDAHGDEHCRQRQAAAQAIEAMDDPQAQRPALAKPPVLHDKDEG